MYVSVWVVYGSLVVCIMQVLYAVFCCFVMVPRTGAVATMQNVRTSYITSWSGREHGDAAVAIPAGDHGSLLVV